MSKELLNLSLSYAAADTIAEAKTQAYAYVQKAAEFDSLPCSCSH